MIWFDWLYWYKLGGQLTKIDSETRGSKPADLININFYYSLMLDPWGLAFPESILKSLSTVSSLEHAQNLLHNVFSLTLAYDLYYVDSCYIFYSWTAIKSIGVPNTAVLYDSHPK